MEIEVGKSYHIRVPDAGSFNKLPKVHIDYILDNPSLQNIPDGKLVVYRVWGKHKNRWFYYVEPYYVLCIWNDWEYNKE